MVITAPIAGDCIREDAISGGEFPVIGGGSSGLASGEPEETIASRSPAGVGDLRLRLRRG
jgi:hypothetical protein